MRAVYLRWLFWFGVIGLSVLLVAPKAYLPTGEEFRAWDKVQHVIAFGILSWLGGLAYPAKRNVWKLFLGIVALGAALEAMQTFVPGRELRVGDFAANVVGTGIGLFVARMRRGFGNRGPDRLSASQRSVCASTGNGRGRKKIVGVISFMNSGGSQYALLRLARGLRARGHLAEVWSLYEKMPCDLDEEHTFTFVAKPKLSLFGYLRVYVRLVSRLWRERPDAVLGFLPLGNIFGLSAATLAGVPRRVASQRSPGASYRRVARLLDRMLGSSEIYHSIVCVSDAVRASFSSYPRSYRDKLCVIHNGIDWSASDLGATAARRRLGLPVDRALIVAVGRLDTPKNYPLLIGIAAKVGGAHFAIAGDGALRQDLEALARSSGVAGRVSFLGNLDRKSVRHLLKAADIFVQTSLFEGQSNAILEAMHEGLPILASDIPGQRETLCDHAGNLAGVLVSPDDRDGWVSALMRLLDDPQRAEEFGSRARDLVQQRFSLERMIDEFEKTIVNYPAHSQFHEPSRRVR